MNIIRPESEDDYDGARSFLPVKIIPYIGLPVI
jgi:hypothetical protein